MKNLRLLLAALWIVTTSATIVTASEPKKDNKAIKDESAKLKKEWTTKQEELNKANVDLKKALEASDLEQIRKDIKSEKDDTKKKDLEQKLKNEVDDINKKHNIDALTKAAKDAKKVFNDHYTENHKYSAMASNALKSTGKFVTGKFVAKKLVDKQPFGLNKFTGVRAAFMAVQAAAVVGVVYKIYNYYYADNTDVEDEDEDME